MGLHQKFASTPDMQRAFALLLLDHYDPSSRPKAEWPYQSNMAMPVAPSTIEDKWFSESVELNAPGGRTTSTMMFHSYVAYCAAKGNPARFPDTPGGKRSFGTLIATKFLQNHHWKWNKGEKAYVDVRLRGAGATAATPPSAIGGDAAAFSAAVTAKRGRAGDKREENRGAPGKRTKKKQPQN